MSNISSSRQVFISYAREDFEIAERIYSELKNAGIKVWMDKKNIFPGQNWNNAIQDAISKSRYFIALFYSNSVRKIGYIHSEFKYALEVSKRYPPDPIFTCTIG
jgi:adenylate kinase family enzyme